MGGRTTGTQDSEADSGTGSVCEEEADDQVRPSLIDFPARVFHILNGFCHETKSTKRRRSQHLEGGWHLWQLPCRRGRGGAPRNTRVSHFYTFFELSYTLVTTQAHGL